MRTEVGYAALVAALALGSAGCLGTGGDDSTTPVGQPGADAGAGGGSAGGSGGAPAGSGELDDDGVPDDKDNCPATPNNDQADRDADGVGDACDNCPATPNANQSDACGTGEGCRDGARDTLPCGQNGRGGAARVCASGTWGGPGPCQDPDECIDGALQARACDGGDGGGEQERACGGGIWSDWSACAEGACTDGDVQTNACGPDGAGQQRRGCMDGAWSDWGTCELADECAAGETQSEGCAGGQRSRVCDGGRWGEWGPCEVVGECEDGAAQTRDCDGGEQSRACVGGVWSAWGACMRVGGECNDGALESQACDGGGMRTRTCANGRWGGFGPCEVPPECVDGERESEACDGGTRARTCEGGRWSGWSPCAGGLCDDLPTLRVGEAFEGRTAGNSLAAGSCGGGDAPEQVVRFESPARATWTFETVGSDYDTVLYVRRVCAQADSEITCNDDIMANALQSRVIADLAAGEVVYLVVDGFNRGGAFRLTAEQVEDCAPSCEGRTCGDDGCGGSCGGCADDRICRNSQCVEPPPVCGDGVCNGGEGCEDCPGDCGECGPECVGTWRAIPALTVTGETIAPTGVVSSGEEVITIYGRPGEDGVSDLATYTPEGGWRTFRSQDSGDISHVSFMEHYGTHVTAWAYLRGLTGPYRARYDLDAHSWTFDEVFWNWNEDFLPTRTGAGIGRTRDVVAFEGEFYRREVAPPRRDECQTRARSRTVAFDVDGEVADRGDASPLGSRAGPQGIGVGDQIFFWGGTNTPLTYACWHMYTRNPLYDGAFYDTTNGAWGPLVAIPQEGEQVRWPTNPKLVAVGDSVLLFENTFGDARVHRLSPGQVEFQTQVLPAETGRAMAASGAVYTVTGDGRVVFLSDTRRVVYDPATHTDTQVCEPPEDIVVGDNSPTIGGTASGAVLFGGWRDNERVTTGAYLDLP